MLNNFFKKRKQPGPDKVSPPIQEAEALFSAGKVAEAFDQYARVVIKSRDLSLLGTAERWLGDQAAIKKAGEPASCLLIARLTQVIDNCEQAQRERLWDACLRVLRSFAPEECAPRQDTTDRYAAECILLRHMGRSEEALKAAREGIRQHNTASCATFAGLCCVDQDDIDSAEEYIRQGVRLDPSNLSGCNDLADYFFNHCRYQKAMEYYGMVVESGDRYDCEWAEPSWLFCRYLCDENPLDLERLAAIGAANPDNNRASWLCGFARWQQKIPYVDYIPSATDACVNMLRTFREKNFRDAKMSLTCLEAPSAVNALRLDMSRFGQREAKLEVIVSHIPDPPLDEVLIPEGVRLWRYLDNLDTEPAVERPTERALARVKELAEAEFSLGAWYQRAGELVSGLDAQDAAGLYGCMVYPPAPEDGELLASDWLQKVQYAAVCLLARLGGKYLDIQSKGMEKYAGALPSPHLVRICLGQLDWPVIPALTLLAWQGKEGLAPKEPMYSLLCGLLIRVPQRDYCFFEHALVSALSWFPGDDEEYSRMMRQRRRRLEES